MFNKLGDRGAEALAGSTHLSGLEELNLVGNGIGDTGREALSHSAHLQGLRRLNLHWNPIRHDLARDIERMLETRQPGRSPER